MKIAVFGAGAVGGHLAARLARAGAEVSVVARGAHLEAIQQHGLRFTSASDEFVVQPQASANSVDLGPQDLVISAVKAHALPQSIDALLPLLKPDTPIVFAINGIPWWYTHGLGGDASSFHLDRLDPGAQLAKRVGARRAIGCVVYSANEVVAPGHVRNRSANDRFVLGEPDGSHSPRLAALASVLREALPAAPISPDIRADIWRKLLQNLASSVLGCLTQSTSADVVRDPALRALFVQLVEEGARVAAAAGVAVAPEAEAKIERLSNTHHRCSMLQDLQAGRPMEIDAQLAAVQDLARQTGVATPTLDSLLAILIQLARVKGLYPAVG